MYNGHADVTALLKTDGSIAGTYYYDAFGNITDTTGTVNNSVTYAGYQYDKETGLYYLNARYYDPNDPLSLNLYTYCSNNPIIYTDPTGHWQQGDENLNQDARIAISRLTDVYCSTNDPSIKAQCAAQAQLIRDNPDNKAATAQNSAVGAAYDAELKKDGSVSTSEWLKISNTYNGSTTQDALRRINDVQTSGASIGTKTSVTANTISGISLGLTKTSKPTQSVDTSPSKEMSNPLANNPTLDGRAVIFQDGRIYIKANPGDRDRDIWLSTSASQSSIPDCNGKNKGGELYDVTNQITDVKLAFTLGTVLTNDNDLGAVYLRTDKETGAQYIGQAKSLIRYKVRQWEHSYKNGKDYEFEVVGRAKAGKDLDVLEQTKMNEYGLPKRYGGDLENARYQIRQNKWGEYNIKDPATGNEVVPEGITLGEIIPSEVAPAEEIIYIPEIPFLP